MKASVIICTYNRAGLLKESIESIQTHDFPGDQFEIVVVNNNSTDGTAGLVKEIALTSPVKIKYVFESQQGLSYARNAGIKNADGEIIVFTDDDIEAEKSWLRELVAVFDSPDVFCAGGPIRPIWLAEKPEWLTEQWQGYLTISEFPSARKTGKFKGPNYPWGANISFRKEVFKTVGLFPTDLGRIGPSLLSNEEINLCKKIEESGKQILFSPNAVIYHKIPSERMRKIWFYHRTYWQGRSDAILDLSGKAGVYGRLKHDAAEILWREVNHQENAFERECSRRAIKGYFYQVLQAPGNDSIKNDFRRLRVLETFMRGLIETAERLSVEKGNEINQLKRYIDEKHADLKKYDELVKQKDEYLRRQEEEFEKALRIKDEKIDEFVKYIDEKLELLKRYDLLMQERDKQVKESDEQIRQRDALINRKDEQIRQRDALINRKDEQINLVINSMSWKITAPIRKIYSIFKTDKNDK